MGIRVETDKMLAWYATVEKRLLDVPRKFSQRTDVQEKMKQSAQMTMALMDVSQPGGRSYENIKAAPISDENGKGIRVYEELNDVTKSIAGKKSGKTGEDPYVLFFLTDYAKDWFNPPVKGGIPPQDFFVLWPAVMRPIVENALAEEVREALR